MFFSKNRRIKLLTTSILISLVSCTPSRDLNIGADILEPLLEGTTCSTWAGSCPLIEPLRKGVACYCPSPYGPITGIVQ